jgi:hypothetical protein
MDSLIHKIYEQLFSKENIVSSSLLDFTDPKHLFYLKRTKFHINLVKENIITVINHIDEFTFDEKEGQEIVEKLSKQKELHDLSKFKEPEIFPYIELTWSKREDNNNKDKNKLVDPAFIEATEHHVLNNPHHPEYWDKENAKIDPDNRDKTTKCVDASKMEENFVIEMVCDWYAMSQELKTNTAREWFNKQKNVRWKFTSIQEELIEKTLTVLEKYA